MLFDFTYYNPTRIHFGKDSLSKLKEEDYNKIFTIKKNY